MKRLATIFLAWLFSVSFVLAQNTGGNPLVPNGASGGGGGGGSVNNIALACPNETLSPSGGTITFANGIGEVPETGAFQPSASQCGALFDSTGGAPGTLPPIGASAGDVENPYFVIIKNADTASTSMTVSGGGTNINYNGSSSATITLTAGQSAAFVVNAANNLWQATSNSTGSSPPPFADYKSNRYYPSPNATINATGVVRTASEIYCGPFLISSPGVTIADLAFYAATGDASNYTSFAIYTDSGDAPGTLVDTAAASFTTTSATQTTEALAKSTDALNAGIYWICDSTASTTQKLGGVVTSTTSQVSIMGAAALGNALGSSNVAGIACLAGGSCGTGTAAWSGSTFTWPSTFTSPTWTDQPTSGYITFFIIKVH